VRSSCHEKNTVTEELFCNRELSWLAFNRRVLELAADPTTPLLERVRFLTICSTNLDEFVEVRVAGLKQQVALGVVKRGADGLAPSEHLHAIGQATQALVADQYALLNNDLIGALRQEGIHLITDSDAKEREWLRGYFKREVLPVLTPMGLDPAHPFPRIANKTLNFMVRLEGKDAFGRGSGFGVVRAPRSLPRLIPVPKKTAGGELQFVLLTVLIRANIHRLFPGMQVTGCYQFRVTRNSHLWVDEEESDDLLDVLSGQLPSRHFGDAVRLEVGAECPDSVTQFLLETFRLQPDEVFRVPGPVNLLRLAALYDLVPRPDLKFPAFQPTVDPDMTDKCNLFDAIRARPRLLHLPFQSFQPVSSLLDQAALDPQVLAIKMTLYRTGADSAVVDTLVEACHAGKEVTVIIELRARFDEAANIELASRLQDAGANVVYGVVGFKTHSKMLMVVRREGAKLRRYVHLGTGNYHPATTTVYTDFGLLSDDADIGEDVHRIFLQLTGLGKATRLKKLDQSPFSLNKMFLTAIRDEAARARAGDKARIVAKMNSLSDRGIIHALYDASEAGVHIDLIVRGICCLRPGLKGVSERIRVRSILGRFLEHSRVFLFHAGGQELLYLASADWMERNLHRRVETAFPVEDPLLKRRVIDEGLKPYLAGNVDTWEMKSDGTYARIQPGNHKPIRAQGELLVKLGGL
jgi:polyphosphate kinase